MKQEIENYSQSNDYQPLGNQTSSPWGRLGGELILTFTTNRKFYIQTAAICAAAVIIIAVLNIFVSHTVDSIGYTMWTAQTIVGIGIFYLVTCSAFIVSNITTKPQRIAAFMLPASKLEKFVSRYIHLLIVIPVAALIGFVAGDLLQMALSAIAIGNSNSVTVQIFDSISNINGAILGYGADTFDLLLMFLYAHSLCLIIGIIFRRHAWIKTVITIGFAYFLIIIIVMLGAKLILDGIYGSGNYNLVIIDNTATDVITDIVSALLIVFNYWATFKIYSRMQVVANKWHNF